MKNRCAESAQYDYRLADVRWRRACRAALCGLAMACIALGINAQGPAADPSSTTSPGVVTTAGASRAKLTTIILRNLERTSMNETPVTKNDQDAPPLAVGRNERSWGWARCPRQDAVESVLGFQVLKAPPLAAG